MQESERSAEEKTPLNSPTTWALSKRASWVAANGRPTCTMYSPDPGTWGKRDMKKIGTMDYTQHTKLAKTEVV